MLEISKLVLSVMPLVAWIAGTIAARSGKTTQRILAVLVILVSCTAGYIQIAM